LSRDLKQVKEEAMGMSGGRAFQAVAIAYVKALR